MANSEQQVVKLMAQEIIKAIKKLNEENNKNYVDNQLKNIKTTNVGGGVSIPSNVTASQVVGLYSAIASYIANSPENSLAGDQEAGKIVSTISGLAAIEIQSTTIDTAQIENLYSSYGEFLNLVAKNAEIEGLDVEELRAAMSEMGLANIGSASIGWGQIKDLVTDTAIIREGVGGKLYIDRLAVTDAQILSLTTGELVIQGSDGKLYTVYVDANGDVVTALRTVSGDDIEENTITGALIAEDAITARELNVSQIFADSALINAIKAANIDVDDLFSNNAFINILTTSIIQSSSIGSELDISRNSSIVLTDKKIGLVVSSESTESNLVLTDKMVDVISNQINLNANKIDFSANESITAVVKKEVSEISDVLFVGEEPAIPVVDMVWLDTSISPNLFKRYDGTGWVVINDISSIVPRLNSAELKIDANTAAINLNTKSIDALGLKVESAELKITPEAITQVVRDSDTYKEDLASATMTADKFETFVSGSQGISSISQKANEIDLLIESDSSSTEVKFTDATIQAFTDEMKVNVTDQIELKVGELQEQVDSAETKIQANTDAIALKASEQDVGILKEKMAEAEEKITPEAIVQTVRTSQGYAADLEELSDRITMTESSIEQQSDEIALRVTKEEYSIIENKVVEQQSQIVQHADSITLLAGRMDDVEVEVEDTSIHEGATPPEVPLNEGKIWLDSSVNPPIFRRWLGLDVPTDGYYSVTKGGSIVQTPSQFNDIVSVSTDFFLMQDGIGENKFCVANDDITDLNGLIVTATAGSSELNFNGTVTGSNVGSTVAISTGIPAGTYTISVHGLKNGDYMNGVAIGSPAGTYLFLNLNDDTPKTFTVDVPTVLKISCVGVANKTAYNNETIKLQVESGRGDPYPAGGGRNLMPNTTPGTAVEHGVTFEMDEDGTVRVTGTNTNNGLFLYGAVLWSTTLKPGTYTFSGIDGSAQDKFIVQLVNIAEGEPFAYIAAATPTATFTLAQETQVKMRFYVYNGAANIDSAVKPMLEAGSVSTEYAPYSNIRPITGYNVLKLNHTGKNLFVMPEETTLKGVTLSKQGDAWVLNGTATGSANFVSAPITLAGGEYTLCANNPANLGLGNALVQIYSATTGDSPYAAGNAVNSMITKTITGASDYLCRIRIQSGATYDNFVIQPQLELGGSATPYEPYQRELHTVQLGQTVYGGRYDWLTGNLTAEWAIYTVTGNETWRYHETLQRWETGSMNVGNTCTGDASGCLDVVCSHSKTAKAANNPGVWVYSSSDSTIALRWKMENNPFADADELKAWLADQYTAGTPVQFAYKLAVPIEIQLDPQLITPIDGTNVFYGDGTISATYTGTGWETVNDTRELEESISKTVTKTELQHIIRIESDGLHVGAQGSQSEAIIDNDSFDIAFGGQVFSSFAGNYVEFGNYQIRRTADGGLAFKLR